MFQRNLNREAFRSKRSDECGGFAELTAAQVAPIFARVTGIPQAGFEEIRSGWWARPAGEDVFRVLHFQRNARGLDYRFRWGSSLPWVPRMVRGRIRWHRTLKAADFDLWDQAHDYLVSTTTPWQEADRYFPDRSLGEACFEEDLTSCWTRLGPVIESWWSRALRPEGVLHLALEQAGRAWEGPRHAPDPRLVAAFTQARLGSLEEARTQLTDAPEYAEDGAALEAALEEVCRTRAT